jgi:N-acetylglucosaminyl-diphospho-decaprenol L-rhamnosyltransferase
MQLAVEPDNDTTTRSLLDGCSVAVVIVNYKSAPLTIACLRSLSTEVQRDPRLRAVVVENDSRDGSAARIADAIERSGFGGWAVCVEAPKNGGYAFGNNLAIRSALRTSRPPEHFLLLNPDCVVRPGAVAALTNFLAKNERVGIVGSCLENPDGSLWSTAFRFPSAWSELEGGARFGPLSRLLSRWVVARSMGTESTRVDWLPGASMMIRREVFENVGLMDEQFFLYYEETDFCLRAQRAGWSCWYVPASRVMHIAGQSTGVTDRTGPPRRTPQYVFDSRLHYFLKNHGFAYTLVADVAWALGFGSWRLRRAVQRKPDLDPPSMLLDSLRNMLAVRIVVQGGTGSWWTARRAMR